MSHCCQIPNFLSTNVFRESNLRLLETQLEITLLHNGPFKKTKGAIYLLSVILLHDLKNHESWSKMSFYSITFSIFLIVQCTTFLYSSTTTCWGYFGALKGQMVTLLVHKGGRQEQPPSNNNSSQITRIVISSSWWKQIPEGTNLNSRQRVALSSLTVSTSVPDSKTQWYVLTYLTDCQLHLSFEVFEAVYFSVNLVLDFWR